ncbi:MAG: SPFH domain-containing protein [Cyanobacteriota bacterium]
MEGGTEMGALIFMVVFVAIILFIFVIFLAIIAARLYKKAQPDLAFVKTGAGGAKVIMHSGALIIPFLHKMTYVNLQTMRLPVVRRGKDALITADRLRADVEAEFYIRVEPNKEKILVASRSLGSTGEVSEDSVLDLVGPKLISALRSVAATKTLTEMHESRTEFANAVHTTLQEDLSENGLSLESVSVSQLDASEFRSETNYFDAQGLRHLTETIQSAIRDKNIIERDTEISIKDKNVKTRLSILDLEKDEESATLKQQQEIEYMRAAQKRSIEVANKAQWAETNKKNVEFEQAVAAEQALREADAQKIAIEQKRNVEQAKIEADIKILEADESKRVSEQQVEITVLNKEAERLATEAKKEQAHQNVITVEEKATAERNKIVEVIKAETSAREKEIQQKIMIDVEKYKLTEIAQAELQASELKAKAIERMAKANLEKALADARGQEALVEAKNRANVNHILMELVNVMPEITKELMAPASKISDVKIFSMNGGEGSGSGGLGKTILNSGMLLPLLEEIASGKNIKDLLETVKTISEVKKEAEEPKKDTIEVSHKQNAPEGYIRRDNEQR